MPTVNRLDYLLRLLADHNGESTLAGLFTPKPPPIWAVDVICVLQSFRLVVRRTPEVKPPVYLLTFIGWNAVGRLSRLERLLEPPDWTLVARPPEATHRRNSAAYRGRRVYRDHER